MGFVSMATVQPWVDSGFHFGAKPPFEPPHPSGFVACD